MLGSSLMPLLVTQNYQGNGMGIKPHYVWFIKCKGKRQVGSFYVGKLSSIFNHREREDGGAIGHRGQRWPMVVVWSEVGDNDGMRWPETAVMEEINKGTNIPREKNVAQTFNDSDGLTNPNTFNGDAREMTAARERPMCSGDDCSLTFN
ncbi:uncharacterized protein G2W53_009085 [Senna tora]|uniref:Uncharacterized protein n=1 Tax=Senna tora TaxID=362788 RepID=A0A835C9N5_9FABA|nr:uncharacterized protein G2W53_009085 [Senna tora]